MNNQTNRSSQKRKRITNTGDSYFDHAISQIVLCGILLVAVLLIRLIGGDWYLSVRSQYQNTFGDVTSAEEVTNPKNVVTPTAMNVTQTVFSPLAVDSSYGDSVDDSSALPKTESLLLSTGMPKSNINEMAIPVSGRITSPFGYRIHPIHGTRLFHQGVDIGADEGDPIVAALPGRVQESNYNDSYGNYVILDHGGGLKTVYAHCQQRLIETGQRVNKGETIALVGTTGVSTGPHLHFEVRRGEYRIDPTWVVDFL